MSELRMSDKDIENLQKDYNEITKNEHLGGCSQIEDFSNKCLELSKKNEELRTPYFVIYSIFKDIAANQYQRDVPVKENEKIYNVLNPSLQNLFENIKTGSFYLKNLNKLINDFEELFNK